MSKDFCMDCGMLLSPDTSVCSVCGFDNQREDEDTELFFEISPQVYSTEGVPPECYPGF